MRPRSLRPAVLALLLGAVSAAGAGELLTLTDTGVLDARLYLPDTPARSPALVVALHGCRQGAEDYDDEPGWSALADELGFLLLLPEQRITNNPMRCFNWMLPDDRRRGSGEPAAIRGLIARVAERRGVDRERVFVTGLSAGGAMAAVMLATYPELFAGGAILGGLPYLCVSTPTRLASIQAATVCLASGNRRVAGAEAWAERVREASDHTGPWPRVSVWHGLEDAVVAVVNARDLVAQWTAVHGADQAPELERETDRYVHRVYHDPDGVAVVELWEIKDMGHAVPVGPEAGCGEDAAGWLGLSWLLGDDYMADVGVCASRRIAEFWGLLPPQGATSRRAASRMLPHAQSAGVMAATPRPLDPTPTHDP